MCITEGDVDRVGCPDPVCVKEGRLASEEEITRVVSESEVQRWRRLKSKQELERG
jgi:E3 ubiquitin-protein ligase RNF14